jgi:phosphatidylethanolamine/phosphatidyl-N-methylethanolamine N-methyltransferase
MELQAVTKSYARWAPIYDRTFGAATNRGRARAVTLLNGYGGRILEVGVGTGLALPHYAPAVRVTGIDFSAEMLAKARDKVRDQRLSQVEALIEMDARTLDFPDASFDNVAAMHILSVVPEPERVMAEIDRVLKPGGRVVITNHFARDRGFLSVLERLTAPMENLLGWHSDFPRARVLGQPALSVDHEDSLPPFGMMTLLVLRKAA